MSENLEAWQYEMAAQEKGRELAKQVEDEMNRSYNRDFAEAFITYLVYNTHPYLRNEIFNNIILGVIQEMAVSTWHDPRDEAAYNTAKYIKKEVDTAYNAEGVNIVGLPHPPFQSIAKRARGCWFHNEGRGNQIYAKYREDLEEVRKLCGQYHLVISDIKEDDKGYYLIIW